MLKNINYGSRHFDFVSTVHFLPPTYVHNSSSIIYLFVYLRSSLFWDVMKHSYQPFRTALLPLENGADGLPLKFYNYQPTLRNIPEERRDLIYISVEA
jgi:hypothetical protein